MGSTVAQCSKHYQPGSAWICSRLATVVCLDTIGLLLGLVTHSGPPIVPYVGMSHCGL